MFCNGNTAYGFMHNITTLATIHGSRTDCMGANLQTEGIIGPIRIMEAG